MRAESDTDLLLKRAETGDEAAVDTLLLRHRHRLRAMVGARLDRRVAARIDPSDVVQESLLEAYRRLPDYLADRQVPFYPWLRQIAWERLVRLQRRHLVARKRAVGREVALDAVLSDDSMAVLASRLHKTGVGPPPRVVNAELRGRIQAALEQVSEADREVVILRHLEQLSIREIMAVLDLKESAVKLRLLRALERLRSYLDDDDGLGRTRQPE
ncbi:MAG: sigma-70 family RNA polymerase sigma factor [Planctomycetia bacterium]|nr:sigma-70 family RNA polymerase sigma factor [Planctomycetia bacterium]